MFLKQFYLENLGHASYLVGSEQTGEALVLDPRRDVDEYFTSARRQGMRIAYAVDTHGHNDYLTGIREIDVRDEGVILLGSAEGDLAYDHRPVKDGEQIEMGEVVIEVLHTPGHTPEHISLLLYDRSTGDEPAILLSGGALLVGDLARPDLLGGPEEAKAAARTFCHTIQEKVLTLPDHVEVFPTHVAGSLCGGNIGSRLSTTVGYERRSNAILAEVSGSDEFVQECIRLDNLPAVPPYWRRMRKQNMAGPKLLGVLTEPPALGVEDFGRAMARSDSVVLDARQPEAFAGSHIPGSLNVGLGSSFPTWAGTVLEPDDRVLLVLDDPDDLWEATWSLLRTGYDPPIGWLAGGMLAWRTSGERIDRLPTMSVHELHDLLERERVPVLDVRQPAEWAEGHIPGATFITGGELPSRIDEVPEADPLPVICGSGYRSGVAASLLRRRGGQGALNVVGGMSAWINAGYDTES